MSFFSNWFSKTLQQTFLPKLMITLCFGAFAERAAYNLLILSPSDTSTVLFTVEAHEEWKYVTRASKSHRYFLLAQLSLQARHPVIKAPRSCSCHKVSF